MRRVVVYLTLVICGLALAACAMTDVASTPLPAMTLNAPPSLNLTGSCDDTKALEDWLQVTTRLTADFQTKMNEAAGKSRADAFAPTIELVGLRDSAFTAATPDCAVEVERSLSDAMNRAVNALQAYVNGSSDNLASMIAEVNTSLDQVTAAQNELINRVNTQIRGQLSQATVTP